MRGKVMDSRGTSDTVRITPAYAGKSCHSIPDAAGQRDHPRLCGEKFTFRVIDPYETGSPPPMRGKDEVTNRIADGTRITPAYAGKRQSTVSPKTN